MNSPTIMALAAGGRWGLYFARWWCPKVSCTSSRTTDTQLDFFLNIPNIWPNKLWGILRYFWSYSLLKSCHCVSLVRDFALLSYFFCKKLRSSWTLQDFLFGVWLWIWAVEILGSNHHASVVRAHDHVPAMCAAPAQVYFFRSCLSLSLLGECLSSVCSLWLWLAWEK